MTPKEHGELLIDKFSKLYEWIGGEGYRNLGPKMGQKCAILCVEQIIEAIRNRLDSSVEELNTKYWDDVLGHIKNS